MNQCITLHDLLLDIYNNNYEFVSAGRAILIWFNGKLVVFASTTTDSALCYVPGVMV